MLLTSVGHLRETCSFYMVVLRITLGDVTVVGLTCERYQVDRQTYTSRYSA